MQILKNSKKIVRLDRKLFQLALFMCLPFIFFSCKKDSSTQTTPNGSNQEATTPSQDVLLQAFYWNVTPGGVWWDSINSKLTTWKNAGITALWLPVVSKGASGDQSMGYDPYDYFDFGTYNQMGAVNTRFGSEASLRSLMSNAKGMGFKLIADIVINHNSGGAYQYSPFSGKSYYTNFTVMSGKFNRSDSDFHISAVDSADEGIFGGFPDLCHNRQYVKDWLYNRTDGVGQYYKNNLGFDGWRFDYVKGYNPSVVLAWNKAVGGDYSIGEYWDASVALVNTWCQASGSGAFDYPLMYSMTSAMDGGNMSLLANAGLIGVNPTAAYTFVANHDIDQISLKNKLKAYAFILTSQGTPFIFYTDYNSLLDTAKLNNLIWIRKNLAAGTTTNLLNNSNEFIFSRNGTPGVVTYLNIGSTIVQETVKTNYIKKVLKDYTGANPNVTTDSLGNATIQCQANSYAIYSPQ
jgi:alpha-amylase